MNRKVKFRAWIKQLKKLSAVNELYFNGGAYVCDYKYELNPEDIELMQYTGLKDKNGVEIYEGDIVLMHTEWSGGYNSEDFGEHENKGVVSITPSKGVMLNKCLKRDLIECEDQWSKTWPVNVRSCRSVVIGNIYENPELLKPVKNG